LPPGGPGRAPTHAKCKKGKKQEGLVQPLAAGGIRERTRAGLETARAQGRGGGRRPKLNARQQDEVIDMVTSGRKSAADVARLFGVHPSTISRIVSRAYAPRGGGLRPSESSHT